VSSALALGLVCGIVLGAACDRLLVRRSGGSPPSADHWTTYLQFVRAGGEYLPRDTTAGRAAAVLRVRCLFRNMSPKPIAVVRFSLKCVDVRDGSEYDLGLEDDDALAPGATSDAAGFWEYADNPALGGEPYDRVRSCIGAGAAKWRVRVEGLSFGDGTVMAFTDNMWQPAQRP
jgi:hypothetical protein